MNGCEASFNIYTKMLYFPPCACIRTVAVPVICTVWSFASLILPVLHVSTDDLQEIGIELYKVVDTIFIELPESRSAATPID
jgi:hypothetical protein